MARTDALLDPKPSEFREKLVKPLVVRASTWGSPPRIMAAVKVVAAG
jgi:hypothetical protein